MATRSGLRSVKRSSFVVSSLTLSAIGWFAEAAVIGAAAGLLSAAAGAGAALGSTAISFTVGGGTSADSGIGTRSSTDGVVTAALTVAGAGAPTSAAEGGGMSAGSGTGIAAAIGSSAGFA